ncbi:MAG: DegT/DnrJ/EryC1/StrS family aminotransferase [Alphaproteobacteria bacterium]|nr:DegT/DnrJ/EryC1/StrS family aminotransferase [Alphaproteobacteria bacterium]
MTVKRNIAIALPSTGEEEWLALREPVMSGWLTQGPKVAAFEKAFAERHHVAHAFAVTSCTTGLHLALLALGVGPGDEVIVPAFTWVATANAVIYCGAKPVFCDVDRKTFNIDPLLVPPLVTSRTKALIAVHLFGLCADMSALREALPAHVGIVEDAACAAGAAYQGKFAGGLGEVASFSFHPRKSITTGEGGMVTTNHADLAVMIDRMRNHGATVSEEQRHRGPRPYLLPDFDILGYNYRMTDLQGAIGLVQLGKLDFFIEERSQWAAWYRSELEGIDWLRLPDEPTYGRHAWQAYVTYVDPSKAPMPRNQMMERLQESGISTRPGTHAIHMLGFYKSSFSIHGDDFPASRDCDLNSMAIPLHNRMVEADYAYVVKMLKALG